MKTVLDLIGEYASLTDAKVRCGGNLAASERVRWLELRAFYDLLMTSNGLAKRPLTRRFTRADIREQIQPRGRLRVPLEQEMALRKDGEYLTVRLVNVSRGGVYVDSDTLFPPGTRLTLLVTNAHAGSEAYIEAEGEVAWISENGVRRSGLPRGMGIRFVGVQENVRQHLDFLVLDTLEGRLSRMDVNAIAPDFVERENLSL